MSKLNDKTDKTKGVIHLMVTSLCDRDCPYCCNKQYDLNDIPYVTNEELLECHTLFITGGEPFAYSNPSSIAHKYKLLYPNIERVVVYTNAYELYDLIFHKDKNLKCLEDIDGLNISIKYNIDHFGLHNLMEEPSFTDWIDEKSESRIYDFLKIKGDDLDILIKHFNYFKREWQEDFEASDDSIFRKV